MSDELTPDEFAELKHHYGKLFTHPLARLIADHERLLAKLEAVTSDSETFDYRRGYAAGVAAGLEQAAKMCDARAVVERTKASRDMDEESCGRALSREAAARYLAAAIRVLAAQPAQSAPPVDSVS
jgi:hypothetical protein